MVFLVYSNPAMRLWYEVIAVEPIFLAKTLFFQSKNA